MMISIRTTKLTDFIPSVLAASMAEKLLDLPFKSQGNDRLEWRFVKMSVGVSIPPSLAPSEPTTSFGSTPMKRVFRDCMVLLSSWILLAAVGCNQPAMTEKAAVPKASGPITAAKFEQVVNQDKLVLVKFGATWCGPCRSVDKELAALSGDLPSDVEVLSIDVDENPELSQEFQITGIPRILIVRSGEVLADKTGYMSKSQIQNWIGEHRVSEVQENPYAD